MADNHTNYMKFALFLAKQGLGRTYPNPSVGCVIVKNNHVIAYARTANGGRPHAEYQALQMAGSAAKGATAYVTLEPCVHCDTTPSCTQLLIDAGITECFIAVQDTDSRTRSKGIAMLKNAGIKVTVGLFKDASIHINKGFYIRNMLKRPMFTAKIAVSLDGKIGLSNGVSKWITGTQSRRYAHMLRSRHDAIIVGAGTVRADNPMLDCRLPGMQDQSPERIILGQNIPQDCFLLTTKGKTHILNGTAQEISSHLYGLGYTRVLIEGGEKTITQFMNADLIDNIAIFRANKIMGGESFNAVGSLKISSMQDVLQYKIAYEKKLENDRYMFLSREIQCLQEL